jgi:arylsulfatase A-like enzyme
MLRQMQGVVMSRISRRILVEFLIVSFVALAASVSTGRAAEPAAGNASDRPNVLFIAVDDLNDFPTFAGNYPDARTPNMDRLARRGVVFTRAHCQFPLCGPSRASIMSGMLPSTLGYDNHMKDEHLQKRAREMGTELLHTYFAQYGYKTLAVGKICHHHVPAGSVDASGGRGSFHGGTGKLRRNWPQEGTSTDWAMAPERDAELPDHQAAEWAVNQLQADHDKPFLLMVGFLRPHVPWYVPKKWFDLYDKEQLTLPPYKKDDLDDVPAMAKEISILKQMPRTEWAIANKQWRNIVQAYLACISFSDHQVGKLLDALENSPYQENTIIVLWSDHGYHMGEKNTFQKQSLWERSSHVPLMIAGPNVKGNQRCNRIVSLLDLYPTLLEMCRLPANPKNEGHSLLSLLEDPGKAWPCPAIIGWKKNSFAVQNERFRYILYGDGSEELYDHDHDLQEWTNLAGRAEMAAVKKEMANLLKNAGIAR